MRSSNNKPFFLASIFCSLFIFFISFSKKVCRSNSRLFSWREGIFIKNLYEGGCAYNLYFRVSSALLSILIFALYLNSPMVFALYNSDKILWLNIPVLLFWVCWVWLKAFRQKMPGDPIVFAVNDG